MNNNIERNKKIIALYQSGLTQSEVASELSVTRDIVQYALRKNGIKGYEKVIRCKGCGADYKTSRRHAKYCSDYCRLKYNKRTKLQREVECNQCGEAFTTYKNKYCSDECRMLNRRHNLFNQSKVIKAAKRMYIKRCIDCRDQITCSNSGRKLCSKCRTARAKARVEQAKVKRDTKCKECGRWFSTTRSRQRYCSATCSDKFHYRLQDIRRRKKILSNGEVHWDISIERLIIRDKSKCYLCGDVIDHNDYFINDNGTHIAGDYYPSIEHVKPVSKGGTHTWDNVKLAHRICNTKKSDKEIEKENSNKLFVK